ncbi:hypothetical protein V6N13_048002 [Hibiscus sabdariffa]
MEGNILGKSVSDHNLVILEESSIGRDNQQVMDTTLKVSAPFTDGILACLDVNMITNEEELHDNLVEGSKRQRVNASSVSTLDSTDASINSSANPILRASQTQ